jgi:capsid protein
LEQRLAEAFDALWDSFVDPADALIDADGMRWQPLGAGGRGCASSPVCDEAQLADIRAQCRALALENEFAINAHENRINYIVGTGHLYRAAARRGAVPSLGLVADVQAVVDDFCRRNRWYQRQEEIVRRRDRDGECFLRLFTAADGTVEVRFVEPDQVATPPRYAGLPERSLGIVTRRRDVESVEGYYIDGVLVPAGQIQHRKLGVDANVKRGLPLFYPVRKNLRRAEKLLRNMSVVAEVQSAIAIIRKHASAAAAGIGQFVADSADASLTNPATGRTAHFRHFGPGTILDASAGIDYEFPAAGIDAGRYVTVLQAELRAIAARLVMPEFMLTSDASNANYSSTMVAEGPAVRMFERLQHELVVDDLDVLWRVVDAAIAAGRLPPAARGEVDLTAVPPTLAVRDRLRDAQADQILVRNGAMTAEMMALRHGLEPAGESQLRR